MCRAHASYSPINGVILNLKHIYLMADKIGLRCIDVDVNSTRMLKLNEDLLKKYK